MSKKKDIKLKYPILCIGDLHAPFTHPNYLRFLKDTHKKYGCKSVIEIGDSVDFHALSRHTSEPECDSVMTELEKAKRVLSKYAKAFPDVYSLVGNHNSIPARQAKELGIPKSFLKSANELLGLPKTWVHVQRIKFDKVWYEHGWSCAKMAAYNNAITKRMSYVQGHQHSMANVTYHANDDDIIFGMSTGCGIDYEAYAFAYGKQLPNKPILSCGVVFSNIQANVEVMDMNKYGRK